VEHIDEAHDAAVSLWTLSAARVSEVLAHPGVSACGALEGTAGTAAIRCWACRHLLQTAPGANPPRLALPLTTPPPQPPGPPRLPGLGWSTSKLRGPHGPAHVLATAGLDGRVRLWAAPQKLV